MQKNISPMQKYIVFDVGKDGAIIDGVDYSSGRKYIKTDKSVFVEGDIENISHSNHYLANIINPDVKINSINKRINIIPLSIPDVPISAGEVLTVELDAELGYINYLTFLSILINPATEQGATLGAIDTYLALKDKLTGAQSTILKIEAPYDGFIKYDKGVLEEGSYYHVNHNDQFVYELLKSVILSSGNSSLILVIRNNTDVPLNFNSLTNFYNLYFQKEAINNG